MKKHAIPHRVFLVLRSLVYTILSAYFLSPGYGNFVFFLHALPLFCFVRLPALPACVACARRFHCLPQLFKAFLKTPGG